MVCPLPVLAAWLKMAMAGPQLVWTRPTDSTNTNVGHLMLVNALDINGSVSVGEDANIVSGNNTVGTTVYKLSMFTRSGIVIN